MRKEKGKSIDGLKYVGDKTKIESARVEEMKHGAVVRLVSEEIPFKDGDELPEEKTLRASKIFGINKSDEDGKLVIIEGSKLDKFLAVKQVEITKDYELGDNIEELIGINCVVQKNEDGFLELA